MTPIRRVIAVILIAVVGFGAGAAYNRIVRTPRQVAALRRELADLKSEFAREREDRKQTEDAFVSALNANNAQLLALNQKPVATVDDVRAALAAVNRDRQGATTTTRPTTTTRQTTTTNRATTTTRPTTTTTRRPTTTTTRCRLRPLPPPVC